MTGLSSGVHGIVVVEELKSWAHYSGVGALSAGHVKWLARRSGQSTSMCGVEAEIPK
jgi:hypothetical protein